MDVDDISDDEILDALETLMDEASAVQEGLLSGLHQRQEMRAQRSETISLRLSEALGSDHPRVAHLRQMGEFSAELGRGLNVVAKRQARRPALKPYEWMVFGRVLDAGGKPVSGLTVEVHDEDRRYHDLLGTGVTDEFGDFSVSYHERAFQEYGENQPELFVTLVDRSGEQVLTTRESAQFRGGRIEYFEIVLPGDQEE